MNIPKDVALVIEIADSSRLRDRNLKMPLCASGRIPIYWIINIVDERIEVYSQPRAGKSPTYRQIDLFAGDEEVPLVIAGETRGVIPVASLMP